MSNKSIYIIKLTDKEEIGEENYINPDCYSSKEEAEAKAHELIMEAHETLVEEGYENVDEPTLTDGRWTLNHEGIVHTVEVETLNLL